jgi:hypothetical protein
MYFYVIIDVKYYQSAADIRDLIHVSTIEKTFFLAGTIAMLV